MTKSRITSVLRHLSTIVAGAAVVTGALGTATESTRAAVLAQASAPKRLLLLTHSTFYNHSNLATIEAVVPEWGKTAGFTVTSLEGYKQTSACTTQKPCDPSVIDLSMVNAAYLSQFDGIMFSTNGELPFTDAAKQALVDFVRNGKGIIFMHQSVVTLYGFKSWGEMLGAYLASDALFDATN